MRLLAAAILCLSFVALSGCGYRLGPAKPAILQNVTKLAIPTFKSYNLLQLDIVAKF